MLPTYPIIHALGVILQAKLVLLTFRRKTLLRLQFN